MSDAEWARSARAKIQTANDAKNLEFVNLVKEKIDKALFNDGDVIGLAHPMTDAEKLALRRAYIVLADTTKTDGVLSYYRFEILDPTPYDDPNGK